MIVKEMLKNNTISIIVEGKHIPKEAQSSFKHGLIQSIPKVRYEHEVVL